MFTNQVGALTSLQGLVPRQVITTFQRTFGDCTQPLDHRGLVTVAPTMESGATRGALDVYAYEKGGGDAAYLTAARFFGNVQVTGTLTATGASGLCPVGTVLPWYGSTTDLAAIEALGEWALCDGTGGTPNLGGKTFFGYASGDPTFGTIGGTGGSTTHSHASGTSGSNTTGITVNNHTGNTASGTTGITVDNHSGSSTGSTSTGLTIDDHSAGVTGSASPATSSDSAGYTFNEGNHYHGSPGTNLVDVQSGTGTMVVQSLFANTASANTGGSLTGGTHSHTVASHTHTTGTIAHVIHESAHTHTLGTLTHTVNDAGHTHSIGTLTHTVNDSGHTHTVPASDTKNHLPPYMVLAFIMKVA